MANFWILMSPCCSKKCMCLIILQGLIVLYYTVSARCPFHIEHFNLLIALQESHLVKARFQGDSHAVVTDVKHYIGGCDASGASSPERDAIIYRARVSGARQVENLVLSPFWTFSMLFLKLSFLKSAMFLSPQQTLIQGNAHCLSMS